MHGLGMWTKALNGMEDACVALTGVRVTARITAVGQRTVVEQVFRNRERRPIEAVYTFPLPEGAAVTGFEAITGDRVLTGAIEEIGAGMEKYERAVDEGHGAFMAELWRPDVFSTRVGNLKPGQAVLIRLTYVSDVDLHERKLRVSFPTTLAPRYATAAGMDAVDAAVDADALNPPHVLAVPYGLELSAEIDLGLAVKSVGSPTHAVRVESAGEVWKVTLAGAKTEMDRNVVIEVELAKAAGASATVEDGVEAEEKFASVTFLPEFETSELGDVAPREIVFVLDCSGSMEGPSIEQAKRALALCLKCLNEGDRFNICRFGSTFELMRPESVPYTQKSLDAALAYVDKIDANLGGTELHEPLAAVLASGSRQVRDVILLTDGQVSNEPGIIKLAATARGRVRIFAFGIGPASSEFLVRGLAHATCGAAAFIAQNERIEDHVMRMFARIASPRLEGIEVGWQDEGGAQHRGEVDMEPRQVGALFDGELLRVAARLRGATPRQVTLTAQWNGSKKTWTAPVSVGGRRGDDRVGLIGASWARQRLAALELATDSVAGGMSADQRRRVIVELSKRYGVLSKETTLIAVEHRSLEERTSGKPEQRRVPVMLAKGWGGVEELAGLAECSSAELLDEIACAPMQAPAGPPPAAAAPRKSGFLKRFRSRTSSPADSGFAMDALRDSVASHDKAAAADSLPRLLMRQMAEGYFEHDKLLDGAQIDGRGWNGAECRAKVEASIGSLPRKVQQQVLDTALTLRALEDCFAERRDLWMMAAKKALRWLKAHAPEVAKMMVGVAVP